MEHPGEYLKREREQRGVPLSKICESSRVPLKFLEALEADDYGSLPHPTFVKGYIKAYCKFLGLDETDAVLRYELYLREISDKEYAGDSAKKKHYLKTSLNAASFRKSEPSEDTEKGGGLFSNGKILAGAAAVLALFAVVYFVSRKPVHPPAEVKNVPVNSENAAEPAMQAGQGAPAPAQTLQSSADTTALPAPAPAAPAPAADKPAVPADAKHLLTASASEMSWIKVMIDNDEPFDVVLRAGEKVSWKADKVFNVVVGNAAGVTLNFDGEQIPILGGAGEVVKIKLPKTMPPAKTMKIPKKAKPAATPPATDVKPEDQKPAGDAAPEGLKPDAVPAPAVNTDSAQQKAPASAGKKWDTAPQDKFQVRPADETTD